MPGGLDIQRHRQAARRWHRYPPAGRTAGSAGGIAATCRHASACSTTAGRARMLSQQRRPPGERRPRRRQHHRLPAAMLRPRDVEVLQQNPPRHPVDGQVVNDQHQLARGGHPQRAEHHPGGRVQPRPRLDHRLIGQHVAPRAGTRAASTDPASGTVNDQPPAPSSSTRSRSMACRSSKACNTTTTSASVTPAGACTTTVWLNCSTGPSTLAAANA